MQTTAHRTHTTTAAIEGRPRDGAWIGRGRRARRRSALVGALLFAGSVIFSPMSDATTSTGDRAIFEPLAPVRILDTRVGPSPLPVGVKLGPGQSIDLQVTGVGGVTADAVAAVMNVTVTAPSAVSHLTLWPAGAVKPTASNVNFDANETIANLSTVKLGVAGKVSVYNNSGTAHVIVDVSGYYRAHTHDDRYYTKAQTDAKFSDPDYVDTAQIKDASVGKSDIGAAAVGQSELVKSSANYMIQGSQKQVPAGACKTIGTFTGPATNGDWVIFNFPFLNAKPNLAFPVQTYYGSVPIIACNGGDTTVNVNLGEYVEVNVIGS